MDSKLPNLLPEPSIEYMDFDIDELLAAVYNWCSKSADGIEKDIRESFDESDIPIARRYMIECRETMHLMALAIERFRPGFIGNIRAQEIEAEVNRCMAL